MHWVRGKYYPSGADKEIEARRCPLNKSGAELRFKRRPSANSFPITPSWFSSKCTRDTQLGAVVWMVLPPTPEGLSKSFKGDDNGVNRVYLFRQQTVTEVPFMC